MGFPFVDFQTILSYEIKITLVTFFEFWLYSKPVAEDSEVGFFKRNSFLRFAFHLSVEGLPLYLEGGVSFPLSDPESND